MSGIKELSVDQMAVLALVLRQGRPFGELAGMLDMDEAEMRRRAHEALDALGPDDAAGLEPDRRAEVSDYLLGQQSEEQRAQTHHFLEGSAPGRAWARVVADQLADLSNDPLPPIPDETGAAPPASAVPAEETAATAAPAPVAAAAVTPQSAPAAAEAAASAPAPEPAAPGEGGAASAAFGASEDTGGRPRSSRLGGALLLGGLALVAVAVALFFVLRGGDDDGGGTTTPAATTTAAQAQVEAQANLVPPSNRKGLKALGVVLVQKSKGQDQIVAAVQGLSKPKTGGYGIWLYSGPGKAQWLGFFASQDSQGRLLARGQLKASIADYREVLVTREAKGNPARPGSIFLRGPIRTASDSSAGG